jgi:hypothetical protein
MLTFRTTTATTTVNTSGYSSSQDYSQYYDPSYWQNYSAWQGYYDASTDPSAATSVHMTQMTGDYMQSPHTMQQVVDEPASPEDDLELVGKFTVGYWICVMVIIHNNEMYGIPISSAYFLSPTGYCSIRFST